MSYEYQNYTEDTLGVKSNNCNVINCLKKLQHLLIFEGQILVKKSIFDYFFDFSSFFYGSEIYGKHTTSKQISKMNTKVHENNFRNFKCVNIIEIG